MRLNRRRLPGPRFPRPLRPAPRPAAPPPQAPAEDTRSGESTEFDIVSVPAGPPSSAVSTHESTVELPSVVPTIEGSENLAGEPLPPERLEFHCPCGAKLIAAAGTYDKHSRCAMCQTVLLLNLVYDPETGGHEIVPFRIDPTAPL